MIELEHAPTSGEVRMMGRSLSTCLIRDRARVRAVASPTADIELPCSAARTVVLGRAPHHDGVETVRDGAIARLAMAATDMGSFEERRDASLSSGDWQPGQPTLTQQMKGRSAPKETRRIDCGAHQAGERWMTRA